VTRPPQRVSEQTQPERTALAWQRTGLGMMAVAGLLAHGAVERQNPVLLATAGAAALLALAVLGGFAPVRYRQVRRTVEAGTAMQPPQGAAATSAVVAIALVALLSLVILR
jgi:putative membrane protein